MERLSEIQKILDTLAQPGELNGDLVCEYQTRLAVYLSYVSERIIESENKYYQKWCEIRESVETDGQATNRAKGTDEYNIRRWWEFEYKNTTYQINSLKKHLNRLEVEKNATKYL